MQLPPTVRNIILAGFMGTGKTTIGRRLAGALGWEFIDTDDIIEARAGKTISAIFAEDGEPAFRAMEADVARELAGGEHKIVATGGGMVVPEANLRALETAGAVVLLVASPEEILRRIASHTHRPLLAKPDPRGEIARLLEARAEAYGRIKIKIETDGKEPDAIVNEILHILATQASFQDANNENKTIPLPTSEAGARGTCVVGYSQASLRDAQHTECGHTGCGHTECECVRVELGARAYPIVIGRGWIEGLGERLAPHFAPRPVTIVTNPEIGRLWAAPVVASLERAGYRPTLCEIPEGEEQKKLATVEMIYDHLLERKATRQHGVIALGGGVVGDMTGFAAATMLRGIAFVQLPTTLLAMVDSSVGGKTGCNTRHGKNLVGAFWQPVFVGAELRFLDTLADTELRSGLAEVIKYGVIADEEFFVYLEENIEKAVARDPDVLTHLVTRSCQIKAGVVGGDEREESGLRAILNFGHTFGHAAEALSRYGAIRHGEGVAMGMVAAAHLAWRRGLIEESVVRRLASLIERAGLPVKMLRFPLEDYWAKMGSDKKVKDGRIRFVLPERLGQVGLYSDLTREEIERCLRETMA